MLTRSMVPSVVMISSKTCLLEC